MNNRTVPITLVTLIVFTLSAGAWLYFGNPQPVLKTNKTTNTSNPLAVELFMIKLDDGGKTGMAVGCGDSLVEVKRPVAAVKDRLLETMTEIVNQHSQYYEDTGLYNALYQSNLYVDSATIADGTAIVKLSGTIQLGGICDDPRVVGQLRQTVLNIPGVTSADITVNGRTLEDVTSERG